MRGVLARLLRPVAEQIMGVSGGAVSAQQATHWSQPSAADAEFLTAANASYPSSGTIIAVINPLAIGSVRGGILDLRAASTSVWLGLIPGSPDTLRGIVNIGGSSRQVDRSYPGGDAALYDGAPKVAWLRWSPSGTAQCGWGKPSAGNTTASAALAASLPPLACTAYLANITGSADNGFGGEYEIAAYARRLADADIDAIVDAMTLAAHAPGDAYLYPRPAPGVQPFAILTDPSTQVVDETAHTWTISTVDGLSPIQAAL